MSVDRKASQVARDLKNFLEQAGGPGAQRSSSRRWTISLVLSSVVDSVLERLRSVAPPEVKKILAPSAWESLGQHLAERLAFALTPTLRLEQRATEAVTGRTDITLLEAFRAFPGALETVAQLIAGWLDAQQELLSRLLRDERVLRACFLGGQKRFHVSAIRPGFSDPHDSGRTATLIEFSRNGRVIYKPRLCEGEQFWFAALRWLDRNGIASSFREPDLVQRKNYSWMEFLRPRSCQSVKEARLFYFRWGAQVALAEILGASDLHRENWLAVGSQLVLVDAELIGDASNLSRRGNNKSLDRQSLPALLETGLLPLTSRDGVGFYRGIAPLDAMFSKNSPPNCWPRYKGIPQEPRKYLDDLIRGFEAVAQIFARADSVRKFFREVVSRRARNANARVLLRSSGEYVRILRESLEPHRMISRGRRGRWLRQKCCSSSVNRAIGCAEARALLRCDLPKFVRRRQTAPGSWKQFAVAAARLERSSSLLRRRVVLGARVHCRQRGKSNCLARATGNL